MSFDFEQIKVDLDSRFSLYLSLASTGPSWQAYPTPYPTKYWAALPLVAHAW